VRNRISRGVRGVVLPTLACSLACGGAVAALAATGVRELNTPATAAPAASAPRGAAVAPPAPVVVRTPPAPAITDAPIAPVYVVRLTAGRR
jgi:hypothetical protein